MNVVRGGLIRGRQQDTSGVRGECETTIGTGTVMRGAAPEQRPTV